MEILLKILKHSPSSPAASCQPDDSMKEEIVDFCSSSGAPRRGRRRCRDVCLESVTPEEELEDLRVLEESSSPDQERTPLIFEAINTNVELNSVHALEEAPREELSQMHRGITPLHAACSAKNIQGLKFLLDKNVPINILDLSGSTPLHTAVQASWIEGVKELLHRGASPNIPDHSSHSTPLHLATKAGDIVMSGLLLSCIPNLTIKDGNERSLLHLAAIARSKALIKLYLNEKQCQVDLHSVDIDQNTVLHSVFMSPLDTLNEQPVIECVNELVEAGIPIDCANMSGETPLYLAARYGLGKTVEHLLSLGADPTIETKRGKTVVHAACRGGCVNCLKLVLQDPRVKRDNLIVAEDSDGRAPFHLAVKSYSLECCEYLLNNGEHLTSVDVDGRSRCSVLLEYMPSAAELLKRLFDSRIKMTEERYDPDCEITFDYSVLISRSEKVQCSLVGELNNSDLEHLLKHPLVESFLFHKWNKICYLFYLGFYFFMSFVILHSYYVLSTFGCSCKDWCEYRQRYNVIRLLHTIFLVLILIPDSLMLLSNFKKYLVQVETYTKFISLGTAMYVSLGTTLQCSADSPVTFPAETLTLDCYKCNDFMSDLKAAAAISSFFGWAELMMLIGRLPALGVYVLMFSQVAKAIIKFIAAFSGLIVGFAVSFEILFKNMSVFQNFPLSLVRTLMMMIGEIDFTNIYENSELPIISNVFLVVFLFLIPVLMANLLIGLAVNDIPNLQTQGKINRLLKQASYLGSVENLMLVFQNLRFIPKCFRIFLCRKSKISETMRVSPNKMKRGSKHYVPRETVDAAVDICVKNDENSRERKWDQDYSLEGVRSVSELKERQKLLEKQLENVVQSTSQSNKLLMQKIDNVERLAAAQYELISYLLSHRKSPGKRVSPG